MISYPSKLLESAVNELSRLPGIGKKTAMRLALHLLRERTEDVELLGESIIRLRKEIQYCTECHTISDGDKCHICADPKRDETIVCVVQDIRDVLAIENTRQYRGVYHILGGIISPIEGISPSDLTLEQLFQKIETKLINEIILALPATIEGDTTAYYIYKKIKLLQLKITNIARGVALGDELEFADEITLGRSIINRIPYQGD
jgi:recombination protein RecR